MFQLFFGDLWSVLSAIGLLVVLVMIGIFLVSRKSERWGRRILAVASAGLLLCIFAVMRDGYAESMMGGTGLFDLGSLQIRLAYAGGAVIGFAVLSSLFVRNQNYRKIMFYLLSAAVVCKALLIEVSRILMRG